MAKCKLFEGWTFRLRRPAPFDGPDGDGAKDFGQSRYNTAGPVQKATLHAPTLRALLAYSRLRTAEEKGETDETLGALGHQSTDYAVAEYHSARKTDCAAYCRHTGKFVAAQFPDGTARPVPYTLGAGQASGTALLFALMPLFEEDEEFRDYAERFRLQQEAGWPDREEALRTALVLCDNIYRRVENARNVGPAAVPLQIPVSGSISPIGALALDHGTYAPTGVLYGTFRYFMPQESGGPGMAPARPAAAFAGKYRLHPRTLSQREEALVPQLPDWYIVPKEAEALCRHAQATTETAQPMRNFLLRGPAGTGKTMTAQAVAAGLHLPCVIMTCNANTEIGDLVGQYVPDTTPPVSEAPSGGPDSPLPKIADIILHPPSVYQALTGIYDEDKTEDDVLEKLVEIAAERKVQRERPDRRSRITYVESPLLQAIRFGWVCELQEMASITNPGVLVGLNALLDNCQEITLPTGERVHRHPDTVIIATTNAGYEGTRPLNQSILSRMDLVWDTELPTVETMVERVMKITGFEDTALATKMALVVRDLEDRCRKTMILDGSVGMREYKAWVQSTMVTGDAYASALATVIGSASADPDNRAELISTCLDAQFTQPLE